MVKIILTNSSGGVSVIGNCNDNDISYGGSNDKLTLTEEVSVVLTIASKVNVSGYNNDVSNDHVAQEIQKKAVYFFM